MTENVGLNSTAVAQRGQLTGRDLALQRIVDMISIICARAHMSVNGFKPDNDKPLFGAVATAIGQQLKRGRGNDGQEAICLHFQMVGNQLQLSDEFGQESLYVSLKSCGFVLTFTSRGQPYSVLYRF